MRATQYAGRARDPKAGFTLTEVLVVICLSTIVGAGVLTVFIWCGRQASLCAKIAWSQNEAMRTSDKLTLYVRNAAEIAAIDEAEGTWVDLRFPDGSLARLCYSNAIPDLRDGRMYLQHTNGTEIIVARGLTEIQSSGGFTTPVFSKTRYNALRIAYRVAEPAASGGRAANDGLYAACVRSGVCLRNAVE